MQLQDKQGFTLVELSVVLVIIGLLLGGVLVGQEMIHEARIKATVEQIREIDSTVNTFRAQYNNIPGDFNRAAAFSLGANGDGNGLITDSDSGTGTFADDFTGEIQQFWVHLSAADLTASEFTVTGTDARLHEDFPATKLGRSGIVAYARNGSSKNYYAIGIAGGATAADGVTYGDALTPEEAFSIDLKLDDGFPTTGVVVTRGNPASGTDEIGTPGTVPEGTAGGANFCQTDGAPKEYNAASPNPICSLEVQISG